MRIEVTTSRELRKYSGSSGGKGIGDAFDMSSNDDDSEIIVQGAGDVTYRISDSISAGLRLSIVWTELISIAAPIVRDRDATQIAATLHGQMAVSDDLDATAGFLVNIDPPAGFSFGSGKVFGLSLGLQTRFE